jgi:pilus assembly protein Flp/PilA
MIGIVVELLDDETGATAVEYSLIAALVSIAAIGGMILTGDALSKLFPYIASQLDNGLAKVGL